MNGTGMKIVKALGEGLLGAGVAGVAAFGLSKIDTSTRVRTAIMGAGGAVLKVAGKVWGVTPAQAVGDAMLGVTGVGTVAEIASSQVLSDLQARVAQMTSTTPVSPTPAAPASTALPATTSGGAPLYYNQATRQYVRANY